MDKKTYEALKALLVFVATQGIKADNIGMIGVVDQVHAWVQEVAKDYQE